MNTLRAELILGDSGVAYVPWDGTLAVSHDSGWVRQSFSLGALQAAEALWPARQDPREPEFARPMLRAAIEHDLVVRDWEPAQTGIVLWDSAAWTHELDGHVVKVEASMRPVADRTRRHDGPGREAERETFTEGEGLPDVDQSHRPTKEAVAALARLRSQLGTGASPVDELLAERRAEAAREDGPNRSKAGGPGAVLGVDDEYRALTEDLWEDGDGETVVLRLMWAGALTSAETVVAASIVSVRGCVGTLEDLVDAAKRGAQINDRASTAPPPAQAPRRLAASVRIETRDGRAEYAEWWVRTDDGLLDRTEELAVEPFDGSTVDAMWEQAAAAWQTMAFTDGLHRSGPLECRATRANTPEGVCGEVSVRARLETWS